MSHQTIAVAAVLSSCSAITDSETMLCSGSAVSAASICSLTDLD